MCVCVCVCVCLYIYIYVYIYIYIHASRGDGFATAAACGRSGAPEAPPSVTLAALGVQKNMKTLLGGPFSALFRPIPPVCALFHPFSALPPLFCALCASRTMPCVPVRARACVA